MPNHHKVSGDGPGKPRNLLHRLSLRNVAFHIQAVMPEIGDAFGHHLAEEFGMLGWAGRRETLREGCSGPGRYDGEKMRSGAEASRHLDAFQQYTAPIAAPVVCQQDRPVRHEPRPR